jgi:hypothetical protein
MAFLANDLEAAYAAMSPETDACSLERSLYGHAIRVPDDGNCMYWSSLVAMPRVARARLATKAKEGQSAQKVTAHYYY